MEQAPSQSRPPADRLPAEADPQQLRQALLDRVTADDWEGALACWARIEAAAVADGNSHVWAALALRRLAQLDAAEALIEAGRAAHPGHAQLIIDHAWVAVERHGWAAALPRWQAAWAALPDNAQAAVGLGRCLREIADYPAAEAHLRHAAARFPERPDLLIARGHLLQDRADWSAALRCWGEVKEQHPELPEGYLGAAQALRQLGRAAEAEAILAPALRLFPTAFNVLAEHAWNGTRHADLDEALRRWAAVREGFPDQAVGYVGAAVACRQAGRISDAEDLLQAAVTRFPSDYPAASDHAGIAALRGDFATAVARWRGVVERFPHRAAAHVGLAMAIRDGGDPAAAEAAAVAALVAVGPDCELRMLLASLALQRGDAAEAARRWAALRADAPAQARVFAGSVGALRELGRLEAAEQMATEALQRFPNDLELERQRALTLSARRDWPAALPLWEQLKRRAPAEPSVLAALRDVLWQARIDQGAGTVGSGDDAVAPFEIPAILLAEGGADADGQALRRLLMRFESLGHTCEFGIVQRRFGAEPLGLLRWASIKPDNLRKALQARFAGMGEAGQTILRVSHLGEYTTLDTSYDIFSHTFTNETQAPRDRFYAQLCKRTMFLRRVLIETIEGGEKILVYKYGPDFSTAQLLALHDAVRAYNPATLLLGVRLEDAHHPSGTVEVLREGLLAGYIDRFSNVDISVEVWLALCRQAAALHDAAATRPQAA